MQVRNQRPGGGDKMSTPLFEKVGKALEKARMGFFISVPRCNAKKGGSIVDGPYEKAGGGTCTHLFVKCAAYDDSHSGNLTRAGSSVEAMLSAVNAANRVPSLDKEACKCAVTVILGLALAANCLHLIQTETTFRRVLLDANSERIGSSVGDTPPSTLHKHILQLAVAAKIAEGQTGLILDPAIPMPPSPAGSPSSSPPSGHPLVDVTQTAANVQR